MASGTAFAISYTVCIPLLLCHGRLADMSAQSILSEVTLDNLVVFSVRYKYGLIQLHSAFRSD